MSTTKIKSVELSKLKPAKYNPRAITEENLELLGVSIERFGLVEPIIWNERSGNVVGGHQRLKVLKKNGTKKTNVVVVDLPPAEEKALNVALNSPRLQGVFTEELNVILDDLNATLPELAGSLKLEELRVEPEEPQVDLTEEDEVPDPPKEAQTKAGDLWLLGKHRLLCGDSTKEEDVVRLMAGKKADLFATDPPYLVGYKGNERPTGGKDWSEQYGKLWDESDENLELYDKFVGVAFEHAIKKNAACYLWHADRHRTRIEAIWIKHNILINQTIIWKKDRPTPTFNTWFIQHEPCLMGWLKGNKPSLNPADVNSNVWEFPANNSFGNPDTQKGHPTAKPTGLSMLPMQKHTKPDDICYEPFCGSGSQLIAGEKLQRLCYALEISEQFCDVILQRWHNLTGEIPVTDNGQKFKPRKEQGDG